MSTSGSANVLTDVKNLQSTDSQAQTPFYFESLQPGLWAASTVCFVAACIATGLRLYARSLKCQRLAWDDYTILVALGFYVPTYITSAINFAWSAGHLESMPALEYLHYIELNSKIFFAASILSTFPLYFAKLSTLFLYNRIFGGASVTFTRICIIMGAFVTAMHFVFVFVYSFACIPISANWEDVPGAHCIPSRIIFAVLSSIFNVSDSIILLMPMPYIWRSSMILARKLQLTGVFLLGSIIVIVGITRTCLTLSTQEKDAPETKTIVSLMENIQNGVAVVASCLPILRPAFIKLIFGSIEESASHCEIQQVSSSGTPLWIMTIGGGKVAVPMSVESMGHKGTSRVCRDGSFGGGEHAEGHSLGPAQMQGV